MESRSGLRHIGLANAGEYDEAQSAELAAQCCGNGWTVAARDLPSGDIMLHALVGSSVKFERDILCREFLMAAAKRSPRRDYGLGFYRFPNGVTTICLGLPE